MHDPVDANCDLDSLLWFYHTEYNGGEELCLGDVGLQVACGIPYSDVMLVLVFA